MFSIKHRHIGSWKYCYEESTSRSLESVQASVSISVLNDKKVFFNHVLCDFCTRRRQPCEKLAGARPGTFSPPPFPALSSCNKVPGLLNTSFFARQLMYILILPDVLCQCMRSGSHTRFSIHQGSTRVSTSIMGDYYVCLFVSVREIRSTIAPLGRGPLCIPGCVCVYQCVNAGLRGTKAPYLTALAFAERMSRVLSKGERGAQWGHSQALSPREGTRVEYQPLLINKASPAGAWRTTLRVRRERKSSLGGGATERVRKRARARAQGI